MRRYYENLTLMDNGQFKNNNNPLKFGLKEVEIIYDNIDTSNRVLTELTGLSEATISRIKKAIQEGFLDDYLPIKKESSYRVDYSTDNQKTIEVEPATDYCDCNNCADTDYTTSESDIININDIHINIYNNTVKEDKSVEKGMKVNQMRIKQWSKRVRERGAYICAKCGKIDEAHSQAHHIYSKSHYPQLACDEGNGIVLCQKCHSDYHKRFIGDEVNAYTFIGWLNE